MEQDKLILAPECSVVVEWDENRRGFNITFYFPGKKPMYGLLLFPSYWEEFLGFMISEHVPDLSLAEKAALGVSLEYQIKTLSLILSPTEVLLRDLKCK